MKLFYSPTSPYARKVRVVLLEHGLQDRVELIVVSPLEAGAERVIPNPLGKIPALELDDGSPLYDSPVICQYLLALAGFAPPDWQALRLQALGNGVIDAAYNTAMERRRPQSQQSSLWLARWDAAIRRSLLAMEEEVGLLGPEFGLTAISWACALGYLDFRMGDLSWRENIPQLAEWYDAAATRLSLQATEPA